MASTRVLPRLIRPATKPSLFSQPKVLSQTRSFISFPGTESTILTETRILPYKHTQIYGLISDVDSYTSFVPYCLSSKVTKWSLPDQNGRKWPAEAVLKVGWGGYEELFTSRLFCSPDSVVEALSGSATTSLSKDELKHYESSTRSSPVPGQSDVFKTLSTKWTVRPFHYKPPSGRPQTDNAILPPRDQTEVQLAIEFQFANPLYAALSSAVAPKVAGVMIEAFEKRARKLLENSPGAAVRGKRQQGILGGEKVGL